MIAYQDFTRLLTDTTEFKTFDAFLSECGGSVDNDDLPRTINMLQMIWDFGHDGLSVSSILCASGLTMQAVSDDYKIPYKTLQGWKAAKRTPPEWQLPLLAYAVFSDLMEE